MRRDGGAVAHGTRGLARRPARGGALLLLAAVALACTPVELEVGLLSAAERLPAPVFTVSDPQEPQAPRYDRIVVLDVGGACDRQAGCPVMWRAELAGGTAPARFAYGSAAGFRDVEPPVPLRPGGEYQLLVSGESALSGVLAEGELRIRVGADGAVVAVP